MREYLELLFEDRQLQRLAVFKLMLELPASRDKMIRISQQLSVSMSTLNKLVAELSRDLDYENLCDGTKFEYNIINPSTTTEIEVELLKRCYLKDSIYFRILDAILFNPYDSPKQCIEALQLTQATFYNRLKELNQRLKPFEIEISNFQVLGNEVQIRNLFTLTYATYFSKDDAYMSAFDYEQCQQAFVKIAEKVCSDLNAWQRHFLATLAYIGKHRLSTGHPIVYTTSKIFDMDALTSEDAQSTPQQIRAEIVANLSSRTLPRLTDMDLNWETIYVLNTLILLQVRFNERIEDLYSKRFWDKIQACIGSVQDLILKERGYELSQEVMFDMLRAIKTIVDDVYCLEDAPFLLTEKTAFFNVVRAEDYQELLLSKILWVIIATLQEDASSGTIARIHSRYFQEFITKLPQCDEIRKLQPCLNIHFEYGHLENNLNLIQQQLSRSFIFSFENARTKCPDVVFTDMVLDRQPDTLYFVDDAPMTLERWQYIEQKMLTYITHKLRKQE
jgi:hypothetical protein